MTANARKAEVLMDPHPKDTLNPWISVTLRRKITSCIRCQQSSSDGSLQVEGGQDALSNYSGRTTFKRRLRAWYCVQTTTCRETVAPTRRTSSLWKSTPSGLHSSMPLIQYRRRDGGGRGDGADVAGAPGADGGFSYGDSGGHHGGHHGERHGGHHGGDGGGGWAGGGGGKFTRLMFQPHMLIPGRFWR